MECDKANACGKELVEIGRQILETLHRIPEDQTPDSMTAGFLRVFAEVLTEVGVLFKAGDVKENLLNQLSSISTYTNLLPYVLTMKEILDRIHAVVKISESEHRKRLDAINKELTRLTASIALIAQSLEDLGKLLTEIIRTSDPDIKKRSLDAFDYRVMDISVNIKGCFERLARVKTQIDEGMDKVTAERHWIKSAEMLTYTMIAVAAILAPFALWFTGAIAGIYALIGTGAATATGLSSLYIPLIKSDKKKLDEIEQQYKDTKLSWDGLDSQLKIFQEKLALAIRHRGPHSPE